MLAAPAGGVNVSVIFVVPSASLPVFCCDAASAVTGPVGPAAKLAAIVWFAVTFENV